jgi:hypothetical protein
MFLFSVVVGFFKLRFGCQLSQHIKLYYCRPRFIFTAVFTEDSAEFKTKHHYIHFLNITSHQYHLAF